MQTLVPPTLDTGRTRLDPTRQDACAVPLLTLGLLLGSACSVQSNAPPSSAGASSAGATNGGAGNAAAGSSGASNSNGGNEGAAHGGAASAGAANAGIAGNEPVDAGEDAAPDGAIAPVIPKTAPFQWVGIIGTGQSLAVGGGSLQTQKPISTKATIGGLKLIDTGPDPKYPIQANSGSPKWAAIPLDEPIRAHLAGTGPGYSDESINGVLGPPQYPNNIQGETPHTALASTLSALFTARGGEGDYVSVHSVVGWAGHCLVDINKEGGKRAYPASLNETLVWKQLAQAAHQTFGVGGLMLTHGECDAKTPDYGAGIYQLWAAYNADIKAITEQTRDVVLFASQQSTSPGLTSSAVQLWQAGVVHPEQIVCIGPKYQYQYGPDLLHLPSAGYVRLGEKHAEIFDIIVNQERPWKPLGPNKITRTGAVVTIDFDVPNPPLLWDPALPLPHQQKNLTWAAGKGFEVSNQSNQPLTIESAVISGKRVVITLDKDPGALAVHVAYATTQDGFGGGTAQGPHGLLRDSDDFAGSDAEQLDTKVTQGSAVITSVISGAFAFRTGGDLLSGVGVVPKLVVVSHDSDDQLTLSAPWSGPSGQVKIAYHHGQANYCVHFAMDEQH